jgi:YHS domain-containing protein
VQLSTEEISVSILAEIILVNRRNEATPKPKAEMPVLKKQAKDPICGMMVEASAAQSKSVFPGNSFYFCCAGCKQKFDKQPDRYPLAATP